MSPDIFPKYLKEPSLLYRISYEELKTLVVQYPYCQNLRFLLLAKSKQEKHNEQERNLKMAATYSLDRTQLYTWMQKQLLQQQAIPQETKKTEVLLQEEESVLVLPVVEKEVNTSTLSPEETLESLFEEIEQEQKEIQLQNSSETPKTTFQLPLVPSLVDIKWKDTPDTEELELDLLELPQKPINNKDNGFQDALDKPSAAPTSNLINTNNMGNKKVAHEKIDRSQVNPPEEKTQKSAKTLRPMPKTSFNSWLKQMKAHTPLQRYSSQKKTEESIHEETEGNTKHQLEKIKLSILNDSTPSKPKKRKKKKRRPPIENEGSRLVRAIKIRRKEQPDENQLLIQESTLVSRQAERSLFENEEIISYTLAKILHMQEKNARALRMYEKLILKFPEKTPLFAAEIEKIKNKHS